MKIIFHIDDLAYKTFPNLKKWASLEDLEREIKAYFSNAWIKVSVSIHDGFVEVEFIGSNDLTSQHNEIFREAIHYAERGSYPEAKRKFEVLMKEAPENSEVFRMYWQILSDEWNTKEAEEYLLKSLVLNPKNEHALVMLGNLYRRDDANFALTEHLYKQALEINPNNITLLCNLAAIYYQIDDNAQSLSYIERAEKLNSSFPLMLYYKSAIQAESGNYLEAFNTALKCHSVSKSDPAMMERSMKSMLITATQYAEGFDINTILIPYKEKLEREGGKRIMIKPVQELWVMAKLEVAEYHKKSEHTLIYKETEPSYKHLMMHELVHLDLIIQAREVGTNKMFVTTPDQEETFFSDFKKEYSAISKIAWENDATMIFKGLMAWLCLQVFNWPLDLIIEDYLYKTYPELRPIQFLTLKNNIINGEQFIKTPIKQFVPNVIIRWNAIMNAVNALQLEELYDLDFTKVFWPNEIKKEAENFYKKYKKNRFTRKPWEEYNDVMTWAKELSINKYVRFLAEKTPVVSDWSEADTSSVENFLSSLNKPIPKDLDYAVVMYCISAIKYFKNLDFEDIKKIAFQVAMLGMNGIDQDSSEQKYSVPGMPWKMFSGRNILAYYFVGFKIVEPSQDTGLDWDREYEIAKMMAS
jgi:tetratricopeptide (TPR) repeat protein